VSDQDDSAGVRRRTALAGEGLAGGDRLHATPTHLVDIDGLPLDRLEWLPDGGVRIGALCRNAVGDPRLRRQYPVLAEALQSGDSHRQAVFGTSEACVAVHPSDCAVALLALDATVVVRGPQGTRPVPVGELHRLPGNAAHHEHVLRRDELVVAIELPARPFAARSRYLKFRDRASSAFAPVSAAVAVELRGGRVYSSRIALGGVAPKPWRSYAAEAALLGRPLTGSAVRDAAAAATEGARPRRDNAYKVELVRRVVRRALTELLIRQ
jgi:xanthine dehydrogenase YagS FAD-binding subunit